MTITSIKRPATLQAYSHANNSNYTQSYDANSQCTQSDIEDYIYNLIQQGKLFQAKTHMELINATNGYIVISDHQFKVWRFEHLRNEISKCEKRDPKNQNSNNRNNKSSQFQKQKRKIKVDSFQMEFTKAYMKLISN